MSYTFSVGTAILRVVLAICIVFIPHCVLAQYESQSYLPLGKGEIGRKFPVKYVGIVNNTRPGYFKETRDRKLPDHVNIGVSGALVSVTAGPVVISGNDASGKTWSVELGDLFYASRAYEADLDRNGVRDLIIISPTGGNGLAPTSVFMALTFDRRGRPMLFAADGYFQESGGRIFDLVDTDGDRRAELIYMNYDDGYWVTSLYEVGDGSWRRVEGRHGRRRYPLYTRFTYRENHRPTTPQAGRHPFAPDLSNDRPVARGRLVSYRWANINQSEDIDLNIAVKGHKPIICNPVSWYSSFGFVLDAPEGRRILAASADEGAIRSLLDGATRSGKPLSLYGRRHADRCSPEWMWVNGG